MEEVRTDTREDALKRLKAAKERKKAVAEDMKAELSEIFKNETGQYPTYFEVL